MNRVLLRDCLTHGNMWHSKSYPLHILNPNLQDTPVTECPPLTTEPFAKMPGAARQVQLPSLSLFFLEKQLVELLKMSQSSERLWHLVTVPCGEKPTTVRRKKKNEWLEWQALAQQLEMHVFLYMYHINHQTNVRKNNGHIIIKPWSVQE